MFHIQEVTVNLGLDKEVQVSNSPLVKDIIVTGSITTVHELKNYDWLPGHIFRVAFGTSFNVWL